MYTCIKRCLFTSFFYPHIDFTFSFVDHFFNAGWMNTTILYQLFQRNTGNLTTYRIKARKYYCLWRIINDEINTSKRFKGADITSFTTDNTSLHLVIWQCHY